MKSQNSLNHVSPKNINFNYSNKEEEQLSTLYSLDLPKFCDQFIDNATDSSMSCYNEQHQLSDSQSQESYEFWIQVNGKSININYKTPSRFQSDILKIAQEVNWTIQTRLSLCIVLIKRILPIREHFYSLYQKVMYQFMQNEYNKIQKLK